MLKVVGSVPQQSYKLEIDDYVPISFRFYEMKTGVPLYWRTGNFKTSLIEVGLNPASGAIYRITVTSFKDAIMTSNSWEKSTSKIIEGIPLCDLHLWEGVEQFSDRFKGEPFSFLTIVGRDFVSFWLAPECNLVSQYLAGSLCIGVDGDNMIRNIAFLNLTNQEISRILRNQIVS
jgi:hypothetical protein